MVWTAWDICDGKTKSTVSVCSLSLVYIAWAEKKQYFTAKASRLDTYRAGNDSNNQ